jgi:RNA recognition motif-containing protein
VRVIKDRETNRPRGFAFVTFTDARDADDAMKELQGTELQGRTVRIDRSTPKGGAGPPRGGSGGGYGVSLIANCLTQPEVMRMV